MVRWLGILFGTLRSAVRTHRELALENLALRQQLAVWKARQPRPRLTGMDRIFWVLLSSCGKSRRRRWLGIGRLRRSRKSQGRQQCSRDFACASLQGTWQLDARGLQGYFAKSLTPRRSTSGGRSHFPASSYSPSGPGRWGGVQERHEADCGSSARFDFLGSTHPLIFLFRDFLIPARCTEPQR